VEGYSRRLKQVDDRISELKDKIKIKEKTEEILVKLNCYERNMQEQSDLHQKTKYENYGH
jgi:hypothetical protein